MVTWLESRFSQNDSTSILQKSFLQNLWACDGQMQFVCTQGNEHFLLQWCLWLVQISCFDCVALLCCLSRIKCSQLAEVDLRFCFSLMGHQGTLSWHLIIAQHLRIVIVAVGLLQPLHWCCVECVIQHERDVRKEQHHIYVAWTSNNRVIMAHDLYCCLVPQCEALPTCRLGFRIATGLMLLRQMHTTALRLWVWSGEVPGHTVNEPLHECPAVVNVHVQMELGPTGWHGHRAGFKTSRAPG